MVRDKQSIFPKISNPCLQSALPLVLLMTLPLLKISQPELRGLIICRLATDWQGSTTSQIERGSESWNVFVRSCGGWFLGVGLEWAGGEFAVAAENAGGPREINAVW